MLHVTCFWCSAGRKKVFEIFCREQLLTNMSLRELTQTERRKAMSQLFKDLPKERLRELKQQTSLEQLRQEALERAATFFKPLTTYEFFAREQHDNPAVAGASPREKEVKLLQIFESLPENAKKAIEARTEQYNTAHSKKPAATALPVIPVRGKQAAPASGCSSRKKSKERGRPQKKCAKGTSAEETAEASADKAAAVEKKTVMRLAASPYSVFVREQMASLHHLMPKERMRVIGERWRSLTSEERQRRLEAAKVKLEEERAARRQAEETGMSSSPPRSTEAATSAAPSPSSPSSNTADARSTQAASNNAPAALQQRQRTPTRVNLPANAAACPPLAPPGAPVSF
ncbi:hypothetical protein LSCM1_00617 [Leishmania martiniquensis]|uniref:HMG box domain-containing protein n=1 Tax=Leishmania martiniquensis TaxID=1580590 RepID=A0A836FYZ8_9TRYP|nr:hypothetical protein LSCM1_00617 [Leishmania martiniquensis]